MLRKNQNRIFLLLALFSIVGVVVLYYSQTLILERFETHTYDLRFKKLRGAISPHPDIGIIAINDKSIAELGRFPWSRKHYVDLIDNVKAAGAKALLMDAFFPEPENAATDQAFADSMARAGNVVLSVAYEFNRGGTIVGKTGSIPVIADAALGEGHINFHPDEDGVNRRSMLVIAEQDTTSLSLGLRGAMAGLGVDKVTQGSFGVVVGDRHIPTDYFGTMLINYTGPPGSYPTYSFADVAGGRVDPAELRGKVLFMGMTALGIYDMRVTPFHANTPGVEINATIADNIISGRFITRSGIESLIDIFFIVALGIVIFGMTAKVAPKLTFPAFLLIALGYIWFANYMFIQGRWLSIVYPLLSAMLAYIVSVAFRFMTLDKRAREIRSVFSSYVSKNVVDQLVRDPQGAQIGGETREVTILFLDIKGFTSFCEDLSPAEVVKTLNSYLAALTRVIMEHDGTVDKFLGDGIMAYWGAPLAMDGHAEAAISCALALRDVSVQMAEKHKQAGSDFLTFRVGINSGEAIAGNIGLKGKKMEYTLIGDNVNLCSRIEGSGKFYGVDILASESTYRVTREKFLFRELDSIRVVGKKKPVVIYELVAAKDGEGAAELTTRLNDFKEGLRVYRSRDWDGAYNIFNRLCTEWPEDKPAQIYRERCRQYRDNPPSDDWDFVFDHTAK